jgi:Fanconi anemia group M protein
MRITVDHREKMSGLVELLRRRCEVEITTLFCGDYRINDRIVVERKTARDFLVSIIDLRLFRQVARLKQNAANSILLIEGNPYRTDLKFDHRAIQGALLSVQAVWQLPVVFSSSTEETCNILLTIGRQDDEEVDVVPLRGGYRPRRIKSKQLYILQGLPGVGPQLARRLLSHFKSVYGVMSAPVEDMKKVDGIGESTALKIREILDRRSKV